MNIDHSAKLYHLLTQPNSPSRVKSLNQQERKLAFVALKALQNEDALKSNPLPQNLTSIVEKLEKSSSASTKQSNALTRFFKGIFNYIFRTSSQKLLNEAAKLTSMKTELEDRIPASIAQKQEEIASWIEMMRFNKEDAAPLYKEIIDFYKSLSPNFPLAAKHLNEKFEEISSRVQQAKAEKKDMGYIRILEKEVLKSLKNLKNYKKGSFAMELEGNILAFSNGLKLATDPQNSVLCKTSIEKLRSEISQLQKRQNTLNKMPFAKLLLT